MSETELLNKAIVELERFQREEAALAEWRQVGSELPTYLVDDALDSLRQLSDFIGNNRERGEYEYPVRDVSYLPDPPDGWKWRAEEGGYVSLVRPDGMGVAIIHCDSKGFRVSSHFNFDIKNPNSFEDWYYFGENLPTDIEAAELILSELKKWEESK